MSYQPVVVDGPANPMCRYGTSKLQFRGPARKLDSAYVACLGGEETFGRFVDQPFPSVLERKLDRRCINFGSLFCGVEALAKDDGVLELVNSAELVVLQLPGVLGQSNRFYRVHPRRNDRIIEATQDLRTLFPEIEFTDVHFVRHLMTRLKRFPDARFEVVAEELRQSWAKNLIGFLGQIAPPALLLWLEIETCSGGICCHDPVQVNAEMVKALDLTGTKSVVLRVRRSGDSDELEDMLFGTLQQPMAEHMIGPATHRHIAEALTRAMLHPE